MQLGPIVFAVILGYVVGDEHLPPSFIDWLGAGETRPSSTIAADCTALGVNFKLVQPTLDLERVHVAEP